MSHGRGYLPLLRQLQSINDSLLKQEIDERSAGGRYKRTGRPRMVKTMNELLARVKLRIPEIMDDSKDALLNELLLGAESYIMAVTGRETVPPGLAGAQAELAVMAYNRMGAEGQAAHAEGGFRASFEPLPRMLMGQLMAFRVAKAVSL
jgi:hypothetical protein